MVKYDSAGLDRIFMALSDPTRRAILQRLAEKEARVTELAAPFNISLPAITKHLNVLERAGLLHREKDGRVRHCRIDHRPLKQVADWVGWYRQFWDRRLGRLDKYLEQTARRKKDR